LAGKPVLAVRDGADPYGNGGLIFGDRVNHAPALRWQFSRNLETLVRFGITLVGEKEFLPAMWQLLRKKPPLPDGDGAVPASSNGALLSAAGTAARQMEPPPAPAANGSVHFITETDLLTLQPGATIRLNPACRLTPLAQDTARRMNIKLLYE
jgi:hypothetical protein